MTISIVEKGYSTSNDNDNGTRTGSSLLVIRPLERSGIDLFKRYFSQKLNAVEGYVSILTRRHNKFGKFMERRPFPP